MTCVCDAASVSRISARVGMITLLETRQNDSRTERLRFSQRESYALLEVLFTKVFRSPLTRGTTNSQIACKTFYHLTTQKTSPMLLFWPCRITAVHSKTWPEGGLSITTSSPFRGMR